jgi:hypothetical protein
MSFPSPTGDPIYDVGLIGLFIWGVKQGVITIKMRKNGKNGSEVGPALLQHLKDDKTYQTEMTGTLSEISTSMRAIAEHQTYQTDLLKTNDERHQTRGKLCAWSDENPPLRISKISDVPEQLAEIKQTLSNTREIAIAANNKAGEIKDKVNNLQAQMKPA